jgi:tetratricopeptide (TPR) repeat protein
MGMMAAYWQPPGQKKIAPIPASAFTPVAKGRAGLIELRTGVAVDMEATLIGEAYVGERPLLRYRFRARAARSPRKVSWDFGDGQTAEGEIIEHVYVRPGQFPIKVQAEISGTPTKSETVLYAHVAFDKQAQHTKDPVGPFLKTAKKYDLNRMDTASLESASALWFILEDVDGQIATARALLARPKLSVPLYFEQAMRLQRLLREQKKDPDDALAVLTAAEERVKDDKNRRAKILREIGDVYYYHKNDLDRALLEYDKVVGRYFGLEDNIVRVTKIRIGDIMRERGNYEKAARNYADAERVRIDKWKPEQQPVRLGMLVHATEDFLRRGNAAEARKWLEIWEWEFPVERLRGQSSILRAKIALLEKNVPEAVKQLEALVRVNPESQYTGEALFMLAKQALTEDDKEKAKKLLSDLVDNHPESEMAPKADEMLTQLEGGATAPKEKRKKSVLPEKKIVSPLTPKRLETPKKDR